MAQHTVIFHVEKYSGHLKYGINLRDGKISWGNNAFLIKTLAVLQKHCIIKSDNYLWITLSQEVRALYRSCHSTSFLNETLFGLLGPSLLSFNPVVCNQKIQECSFSHPNIYIIFIFLKNYKRLMKKIANTEKYLKIKI